ncbi:MAG: GLUG motif-containing protein [Ruminococcus sp.]|nr:GLUG motif-containing protein [Ruminococcus sp.]
MKSKVIITTKKLIAVLLTLLIISSVLPSFTVKTSAAGITATTPNKDGNGVYQIGTAAELYWFADKVNNDNENYGSAKAVLTADIVVNTGVLKADGTLNSGTFTDWTPIGNYDNKYIGTFDGQGHTISGLYFNDTNANYVGLFGCLGTDGEIKNVGVIDSYFRGYSYVGGVCGENNSGTITGCYNTGTVSSSYNYAGGVCGVNRNTITGCYNTGSVNGRSRVGGVSGWNGTNNTTNTSGTMTGCYNIGAVSSSNGFVGGVCGYNYTTITGCYTNKGDVCGYNSGGTVTNCEKYTGNEFTNATVCGLLNAALKNYGSSVRFYQGVKSPVFIHAPQLVDGVYQISCAAELYWFADKVNNDNANYGSAKAVLTADIVVNTGVLKADGTLNSGTFTDWTPIGYYKSSSSGYVYYSGTFDGQGHTISGLYFNNLSTSYVGLFGCLGSGGKIKNVGVIDSYFNGYYYVSGVCGYNHGGTITGCYNTGTVSGRGDDIGGVCGQNLYGSITGCYNTGTVSGTNYCIGGVCGDNYGTITGCYNIGTVNGGGDYVGGVCGYNSSYSTITGCYTNNGGVCGYNYGGTISSDCAEYKGNEFKDTTVCKLLNTALKNANSDVHFCQGVNYPEFVSNVPDIVEGVYQISNEKELYAFANLVNNYAEPNANAVLTADIVVNTGVLKADGNLADDVSTFTSWTPIGNSSNKYTGTFDGQGHTISGLYFNNLSTSYVGLFGYLGSGGEIKNVGVIDSYFKGYLSIGGVCGQNNGEISGCYNTGTVSDSGSSVGGICGENNSGEITGCYNIGTVSGSDGSFYVGGVCGLNYSGTITGSYNTGTVKGTDYVGGVCGNNYKGIITGCYTNNKDICGFNNGTVTNCDVKTDAEFKDNTVCKLLNTALQNANSDVHFYQSVNYPVFIIVPNLPKLVDDVYQISNEKELYAFAKLVNSYAEPSANAVLTADITVNNNLLSSLEFDEIGNVTNKDSFESWDPIGNGIDSYKGKFDGQGHTISGLYRDSNEIGAGLFKQLGSGGEIKNVGVIDSYFKCYSIIGGVCGVNDGGKITGCYNTGTVSGSDGSLYVGGVCGMNGGTITGCYTNRRDDTYYKSDEEFKNGTVCGLLNTALKNANSKVLFCQRIGTDVSPLLDYQIEEHIAIYTVENNAFKLACLCGKETKKTMELTLTTEKTVVVNGADNTLTATLSNFDNEAVTYKWYQNGVEIEGATSSTYNMPTNLSAGTYTYRVDVTISGVGTISSQSVDVIVDIIQSYTVTIPETVTLGETATIKAENVVLEEDKQLEVALTGTSESDSKFKVKSAEGAELEYTIKNEKNKEINVSDTVLIANPTNGKTSETTLTFSAPTESKFSGEYKGTVTFTVAIKDEPTV